MFMQHVHATYSCSMFMQHEHAAWTYSMGTEHGYAAGTCRMDIQHGQATWTCSMDKQHVYSISEKYFRGCRCQFRITWFNFAKFRFHKISVCMKSKFHEILYWPNFKKYEIQNFASISWNKILLSTLFGKDVVVWTDTTLSCICLNTLQFLWYHYAIN